MFAYRHTQDRKKATGVGRQMLQYHVAVPSDPKRGRHLSIGCPVSHDEKLATDKLLIINNLKNFAVLGLEPLLGRLLLSHFRNVGSLEPGDFYFIL